MIRPIKKKTGGGGGAPNSSNNNTNKNKSKHNINNNAPLPLHHRHSSPTRTKGNATRKSVVMYLIQMVVLLAIGSSLIVLIHAVTHKSAGDNSFPEPVIGIQIEVDDTDPKNAVDVEDTDPKPVVVPLPLPPPPPPQQRKRRTTAEANAYLKSQPSTSVDGEKYIKKKLSVLYDLQQSAKGTQTKALITTRYLGEYRLSEDGTREEIRYWLPNNATKDEQNRWKADNKELNKKRTEEDKILFPSLFGDTAVLKAGEKKDNLKKNGRTPKRPVTPTDPVAVEDPDSGTDEDAPSGDDKLAEQIDQLNEEGDNGSDDVNAKYQYPHPAESKAYPNSRLILQPTIGRHRPHSDAVFAFAEGYDLKIYLSFIESLKATGFTGDLVLSVSAIGSLKPGVEEYLRSDALGDDDKDTTDRLNVVVYTVKWNCYDGQGVLANGANEGIRKCDLVGMYGDGDGATPIPDQRDPRPVATARYELYWAWSLNYDPHSWVMLIDSRDAYFQESPFDGVARSTDTGDKEGILYFFAENAYSTTINDSSFNKGWLMTAYGNDKVSSFLDKPVICSGSTMGETVAVESYLRAMVAQFDETKCTKKGCDQGFHNYLHYSHALEDARGIRSVKVFEQGTGIINNLALLRSKPLREWGIVNSELEVLNWDGSVSKVAHQFDRDDEMNRYVKGKRTEFLKDWNKRKGSLAK